ncbi:MAG: hypothetical protein ACYTGZ_11715 [Planctomycetota bacterium]|jgi:hypothetical protein
MTDPNNELPEESTPVDESSGAGMAHIEVAPPVAEEAGPPPPPPPSAGPRSFPQHFSLLFASILCLIGTMSVWEREHIYGMEVEGLEMLSGSFLMALAGYAAVMGVLNILQGRLRGMLATVTLAFFTLYFGIPKIMDTQDQDMFLGMNEIEDYIGSRTGTTPVVPERFQAENLEFPKEALDKLEEGVWQDKYKFMVGQYAPGPLLTVFGGALIFLVFIKGIFGGKKKKEPAPPPAAARRRRR